MIGGDSKFVLTCTHTHVPAPTHTTTHIISLETRKRLAKWGSGLKKKRVSIFPGVDTCHADADVTGRVAVQAALVWWWERDPRRQQWWRVSSHWQGRPRLSHCCWGCYWGWCHSTKIAVLVVIVFWVCFRSAKKKKHISVWTKFCYNQGCSSSFKPTIDHMTSIQVICNAHDKLNTLNSLNSR